MSAWRFLGNQKTFNLHPTSVRLWLWVSSRFIPAFEDTLSIKMFLYMLFTFFTIIFTFIFLFVIVFYDFRAASTSFSPHTKIGEVWEVDIMVMLMVVAWDNVSMPLFQASI